MVEVVEGGGFILRWFIYGREKITMAHGFILDLVKIYIYFLPEWRKNIKEL